MTRQFVEDGGYATNNWSMQQIILRRVIEVTANMRLTLSHFVREIGTGMWTRTKKCSAKP